VQIASHHNPESCGFTILTRGGFERAAADDGLGDQATRPVPAKAYFTFDVDCLDPSAAPGTGTRSSAGCRPTSPWKSCAA